MPLLVPHRPGSFPIRPGLALLAVGLLAAAAAPAAPGPPAYQKPPASAQRPLPEGEKPCPEPRTEWQYGRLVAGVEVGSSSQCRPDNPFMVAAAVRGTNRVSRSVLKRTGLAPDAVEKCCDTDGDGDPDRITLRLEVAEINGWPPAAGMQGLEFAVAPGIRPGFWTFAPKTLGMVTNPTLAGRLVRMPAPVLRVEQGDQVRVVLENTHYFPHTIHLHGVDHAFRVDGQGNDGVPQTSEPPVLPGQTRTYRFTARAAGTFFYHCHVQPSVHVLMGLAGMLVVEPAGEANPVQSLNIGAGRVRYRAPVARDDFDRAYDLVYQGVDPRLHDRLRLSNDPRVIQEALHRRYRQAERRPSLFLLNGRSFPYTVRESQIQVRPDQRVRLRILNAGSEEIALHTHGHRATVLAYDGVPAEGGGRITRDVFQIAAAQRLDLLLHTRDDGRLASGPGVWFIHDHREKAVTTNGIAPGGDIGLITYDSFLLGNGIPENYGVDWAPYFTEAYYRGEVPVWRAYSGHGLGEVPAWPPAWRELALLGAGGLVLGLVGGWAGRRARRRRRS